MATVRIKNKIFPHIRGIIFDKDGTLADSQSYLRDLAQSRASLIDAQVSGIKESLLLSFGLCEGQLNPLGLMAVGSHLENAIAAAAHIAATGCSWLDSLAIAQKSFAAAEAALGDRGRASPLFTGSLEVLKFCHDAGLNLGILSMDSTENVEIFVKTYQLQEYIQLLMGAEFGLKPDPNLFLQACQLLGTEPGQTLMIGDAPGDIQMAKNAGAAGAIGISWGEEPIEPLWGADATISSLEALEITAH